LKQHNDVEMKIKTKNRILLLLFFLYTLSSCVSSTYYSGASNLGDNLQHLNGVFYNTPTVIVNNHPDSYPLYVLLFKRDKTYTWDEVRDYSGKIKIDVISDKKLKASYLMDDIVVDEKMITGKLTGNVFSTKRSIRCLFLLFVNLYSEVKTSIYLNKKDELVVNKQWYVFANILIASGGGDGGTGGTFARVRDE
jgi:hypothetical protein